ncbi:MAG: peptidoglycan DD-metalloendopeptidase family protein [Candidatus Colwellbacteria bacterium]|nr:peptidoglycan DD-metalloendopeptidase family protein [Candidatus Colwellbacteria bacterium]
MKPYPGLKKQFSALFILVALTTPLVFLSAQTATEIKNRIEEKDTEIRKLEKEIAAYQSELEGLDKQKDSLQNSLRELELTRKKLNTDIAVTENKIEKTNLKISDLSRDIGDKEASIKNNTDSIGQGIRSMNELENKSLVQTVLSDQNYGAVWTDLDNMISVRESLREQIAALRKSKVELEDTRTETIAAKNELARLKSELSDQRKIVLQNTEEKNKLLKQTQNSEANYQKLLKDRLAQKEAFEKELENYEAQLQFILDPSKLPKGRILSWPLDKIFVTSPYAPRWGGFHRGTDFRASVGTRVKAVTDGVVNGTGDTDICCPGASFGKWIFIEHNNGLSSTYAHLSLISVRKGQKVVRGQVIGYSGNTGSSTGPHLHVSLYVSSGVKVDSFPSKSYPGKTLIQPISATEAYLDPMTYLPPL